MKAEIKRKRASASSLFLMELVVAILFFTLAASLCISIFVRAHLQNEDAKELNHAVNLCSDAAELIRTSDSLKEASLRLKETYSLSVPGASDNEITIYFDADFEMIMPNAAVYSENISMTEADGQLFSTIIFYNADDEKVYGLELTHDLSKAGSSGADPTTEKGGKTL